MIPEHILRKKKNNKKNIFMLITNVLNVSELLFS